MTKIVSEGFKKWPKLDTLLPREKSFEHTEGCRHLIVKIILIERFCNGSRFVGTF